VRGWAFRESGEGWWTSRARPGLGGPLAVVGIRRGPASAVAEPRDLLVYMGSVVAAVDAIVW